MSEQEGATAPAEPRPQKPARRRSWRRLLTELAIVVLGVGLALAAQQAADWLRWQSEVKAARAALRAEMTSNNLNLFAVRLAIAPCMERQANEAQALIAALAAGRQAAPLTGFRLGLTYPVSDAEWESQRASQVLTHFPREELALMSSYYNALPAIRERLTAEALAGSELSILQDPPAGMTASDIIRLKVNLSIAANMQTLILRTSRRVIDLSEQLGLPRTELDATRLESVRNFCSRMSLAEWRRWQNEAIFKIGSAP